MYVYVEFFKYVIGRFLCFVVSSDLFLCEFEGFVLEFFIIGQCEVFNEYVLQRGLGIWKILLLVGC